MILTGCVSNGVTVGLHEDTPPVEDFVNKRFVGVPVLLSMEGSDVYLGGGWYISAAHNKLILALQLKNTTYHKICDVVVYKGKDKGEGVKLGSFDYGDTLYTVGYPMIMPLTSSKGTYQGYVYEPSNPCRYFTTDAAIASGMSGGGVFNEKGELVGIIRGVMKTTLVWDNGHTIKNPTIFTNLEYVKDWLYNTTGIGGYDDL